MIEEKQSIVLIDTKPEYNEFYSHAQICKNILRECLEGTDAEIISLEIEKNKSGKADIKEFVTALHVCLKIKPLFISLSIGTIRLSDAYYIYPVIKQLVNRNIHIVAAFSNSGYLTVPACFPEVIGVIADKTLPLMTPKISKVEKNRWGVDLVVGYKAMKEGDQSFLYTKEGNSFVVPVAVAILFNYCVKGIKNKEELLSCFSYKKVSWFQQMKERNLPDLKEKPRIVIIDNSMDLNEFEKGFFYLSDKYQVEGALFSSKVSKNYTHILMDVIAALDIIFYDGTIITKETADIEIKRDSHSTVYIYDNLRKNYKNRQSIEQVMDEIIRILEIYS